MDTKQYTSFSFFKTTALVMVLLFTSLFASEAGEKAHLNHSGGDICIGIGAFGEIEQGGIHTRLWINDVLGINLKGAIRYDGDGYLGMGEVLFKPPFPIVVRPYILGGYGYTSYHVDEVFNGSPFKKTLGMATMRFALGAEARLGKNNSHGLGAEVGYVYGSADYEHNSTSVGTPGQTLDTSTYTVPPLSIALMYTFYFDKAQNHDSDNDGILDSDDNCPQEAEDMDGYMDSDGCPDYDNDGDGIADSLDEFPDSVIVDEANVFAIIGVAFNGNSSEIDEKSLPQLDSIAALLIADSTSTILLQESLDSTEVVDSTMKLNNARVAAIMSYLEFKEVRSTQVDNMDIVMEGDDKQLRNQIRSEGLVIRGIVFTDDSLDASSSDNMDSVIALSKTWTETNISLEGKDGEHKLSTARVAAVMAYLKAAGVESSQVQQIEEQIALGKKIDIAKDGLVLRNTTFAPWSSEVQESSYEELDAMIKMLEVWPNIKVEVQGHADSVGQAVANLHLSEERASSVRQYIVDGGIDPSRIISKGYGETQPKQSNSTSEGRKANRRVELKQLDEEPEVSKEPTKLDK